MVDTEKITVNLNVVDLGKIDMLVDEGLYTNRADFLRAAIRNEIRLHERHIEQIATTKSYFMGVCMLDAAHFQRRLEEGKMSEITGVGMLIIAKDVSPALAEQTISYVKIWGKSSIPDDVRERLQQLERMG